MISIFNSLESFVPVRSCLKFRENGEFLIVSNGEGELYYLNNTAKMIYQLFDGNRTLRKILDVLIMEFDPECEEDVRLLEQDLTKLIRDFQWQKIIKLKELS